MTTFASSLLAALLLAQPLLSAAADSPPNGGGKSSSFVPHAHTSHHVYGAPIGPAIVGHAKASHRRHTPKKRSSSAVHRQAK
ncbi:MAG: hypothetical protein WA803_19705 [Steroidobacteraceae bacterium]